MYMSVGGGCPLTASPPLILASEGGEVAKYKKDKAAGNSLKRKLRLPPSALQSLTFHDSSRMVPHPPYPTPPDPGRGLDCSHNVIIPLIACAAYTQTLFFFFFFYFFLGGGTSLCLTRVILGSGQVPHRFTPQVITSELTRAEGEGKAKGKSRVSLNELTALKLVRPV